ncbi:MAG TPA: preprotein translocase subunit YajC [Bacteroidales bacterium]|mgnify:CR=1|jgi:preprotein translocase subunit YajC|nr:preprotein translocase subunit YajC [Bacteroidales bacterium]MDI9573398.1 preprotein translocase subunit YajC [Bacteroidota bacterium]OQC60797.1 MAG: preprotein translocase subunit YajC [Bacteroidetes bacterium ADurb.Bin012]MBP9511436.1 preprotein translocase subunit YajC [Bacteroidales bacterium]MBP9587955.1 preprotein translocase subunit YajC [Bacteroidales bacterium]
MLFHFLSVLLVSQPQGKNAGSGLTALLPLIIIIVIFYFFFIRPQTKKAKEERKYRENLKKGDKVITIGGIHGKIVEVNDTTFIIEVEEGSKLKIEKTAVAMGGSQTSVGSSK